MTLKSKLKYDYNSIPPGYYDRVFHRGIGVQSKWHQLKFEYTRGHMENYTNHLDIGCGPGFFTIDMADMVGETGRVIASDLQEGMLQKLSDKVKGTRYKDRIILRNSEEESLGSLEGIDFALAFYMVHEVPDKGPFFRDVWSALKPGGQVLIAEPPFHVSKKEMEKMLGMAREAGFTDGPGPKMLFSKTVLLKKYQP